MNSKHLPTDHILSTAPMMDLTDRHARYLFRLLSANACLYTEMVTAHAVVNGDRGYLLDYNQPEHPVVLQLGGSDPKALSQAAQLGEQWGYDEINLNVGCPSDRVQQGRFGACLMKEPELVADCITAMSAQTRIPITVKTRIGVDDHDDYPFLHQFIDTVKKAGVDRFIIHARKAILKGLSPKQNRSVPPINYQRAYQIKKAHPELSIIINGEIRETDSIKTHLQYVDGVMIGRDAYYNPYQLAYYQNLLYGTPLPLRHSIVEKYCAYMIHQHTQQKSVPLSAMTRHILGLYQGLPGARKFRRFISTHTWYKVTEINNIIKMAESISEALER